MHNNDRILSTNGQLCGYLDTWMYGLCSRSHCVRLQDIELCSLVQQLATFRCTGRVSNIDRDLRFLIVPARVKLATRRHIAHAPGRKYIYSNASILTMTCFLPECLAFLVL